MKRYTTPLLLAILLIHGSLLAQVRETKDVSTFTKISFRVPGKLYIRQGSPQKVEIEGKREILNELEVKVEGDQLQVGKEWKWSDKMWKNGEQITVWVTVKDVEGLFVSGSGDIIGETKLVAKNIDLRVSGSGNLQVEVQASGEMEADVSGSGNLTAKGSCASLNSDVSGSGKVDLDIKVTNAAEFGISGSGKIMANGIANGVTVSISGSGKLLASGLETSGCNVRIAGSGDVEINVRETLDATISGSGSVSYKGNPSKVNSHSSGSGSVRKM